MENKKNKTLILTVCVCLLPIILGIVLYDKLPEQMPIHFTIGDQIDNYAPKNISLFVMPIIMAIVQTICIVVTNKTNKFENNKKPKIIKIMEWFIPVMTVLIYIIMIEVPLGSTVYVGKSICLILGISFIIVGNYMPKMSYEVAKNVMKPVPKSEKRFRKLIKTIAHLFILLGTIFLILIIWV